jgi:acyl-CoA synthetase (AMP-forming)/AMP-acid ligase II
MCGGRAREHPVPGGDPFRAEVLLAGSDRTADAHVRSYLEGLVAAARLADAHALTALARASDGADAPPPVAAQARVLAGHVALRGGDYGHAGYKVPKKILFADELPKGATGKLQRIGLAQRIGLGFGSFVSGEF